MLPSTFSEPIALEIAERGGAGYLGAQLFAGFMYVGAALCLWPVRAWKIGDNERVEMEKADPSDVKSLAPSGIIKRSLAWKKV